MLPVKKRMSMSEGGTPLIHRKEVKEQVYLKLGGDNPTGSFKDRGTEGAIIESIRVLGREGVFVEPASAAAAAALPSLDIGKEDKIVLVITGSGLKDPNALFKD